MRGRHRPKTLGATPNPYLEDHSLSNNAGSITPDATLDAHALDTVLELLAVGYTRAEIEAAGLRILTRPDAGTTMVSPATAAVMIRAELARTRPSKDFVGDGLAILVDDGFSREEIQAGILHFIDVEGPKGQVDFVKLRNYLDAQRANGAAPKVAQEVTQALEGGDLTPDEEKQAIVDQVVEPEVIGSLAADEAFQDFIDQMLMPQDMYEGIWLLKSEGISRQEQDEAIQAIIASGRGDEDYDVNVVRQTVLERRNAAAAQQEVPNAG
jgi:hypothetical protein